MDTEKKPAADNTPLQSRDAKMDAVVRFIHASDRFQFANVVRDIDAAMAAASPAPKPTDRSPRSA